MSLFDEHAKDRVYSFLKETTEPFYYVRKRLKLVEELSPGNEALIDATNALKNLLFNLYDIVTLPEQAAINIQEAKEHLSRAFYDTHDIIITATCDRIRNKVNQFKSSTITNAFSEYGSTIRPAVSDVQAKITDLRSNRSSDIAILHDDLNTFTDQIEKLTKFDSFVNNMIPELQRYEAEKRNQLLREKTWDLCKIILAAIIGATVTWLITKK